VSGHPLWVDAFNTHRQFVMGETLATSAETDLDATANEDQYDVSVSPA
jgi:hypothetical protein